MNKKSFFNFKYFTVRQDLAALKVGTDSMLLGSLSRPNSSKRILDIGTGTGVLALMLAQRVPDATIVGVEIDGLAAENCEANFQNAPWKNRLSVIHSDMQDYYSDEKFDFIISNPPYYQNNLKAEDQRMNTAKHGGESFIKSFANVVDRCIASNGRCAVIIPIQFEDSWKNALSEKGLNLTLRNVLQSKPGIDSRLILEFGYVDNREDASFLIREKDGSYSEEYKEATKEFHDRPL